MLRSILISMFSVLAMAVHADHVPTVLYIGVVGFITLISLAMIEEFPVEKQEKTMLTRSSKPAIVETWREGEIRKRTIRSFVREQEWFEVSSPVMTFKTLAEAQEHVHASL